MHYHTTVALLFLQLFHSSISVPSSKRPITLFTCPSDTTCYANPRNCVDNCNAAFSMWSSSDDTTTYNITMMSPLSYVAVMIKEQGSKKYDKAIICSFHADRGIVARVNYPDPIRVHQFVDTTEPEGHTSTTYTQCSTTVSMPQPTKARYKLISGKWESDLILDENQAVDVVPAVANAQVTTKSKRLNIQSPKIPAVRMSDSEEEDPFDRKASEKRQVERRMKDRKVIIAEDDDEEEEEEAMNDDEEDLKELRSKGRKRTKLDLDDEEDEEDMRGRKSPKSKKDGKGKSTKTSKNTDKKVVKEEEEEEEEAAEEETKKRSKKTKSKNNKDQDNPRFREYEDEEEHNEEEEDEEEDDADHASGLAVLTSILISMFSICNL